VVVRRPHLVLRVLLLELDLRLHLVRVLLLLQRVVVRLHPLYCILFAVWLRVAVVNERSDGDEQHPVGCLYCFLLLACWLWVGCGRSPKQAARIFAAASARATKMAALPADEEQTRLHTTVDQKMMGIQFVAIFKLL